MLPTPNRLTKKSDFTVLFKEGRFVSGKWIDAKVWKVQSEKYPKRGYNIQDLKIGFVVGLKISKSAVVRNRLKRQMREVVRLLLKEKMLKTGFMIAFLAKPTAKECTYENIAQNILYLLKVAGVHI